MGCRLTHSLDEIPDSNQNASAKTQHIFPVKLVIHQIYNKSQCKGQDIRHVIMKASFSLVVVSLSPNDSGHDVYLCNCPFIPHVKGQIVEITAR